MKRRSDDWSQARPPLILHMQELMESIWDELPEDFRALCPEIILQIDEFPPLDLLQELECDSPYELLGFFFGDSDHQPAMIYESFAPENSFWLYRRPLLDYWVETEHTLKEVITHVMVSEIGHHFGLSDHELALIEVAAGGRQSEMVH